jgi:hypothetical protein
MELASRPAIPEPPIAVIGQLSENSRLGFRPVESTLFQGAMPFKYLNGVRDSSSVASNSWQMSLKAQQQNNITASAKGSSVTYTYPDGSKIVLTGDHPFRDNNPGDLRPGHGSIGRDGGFAIYPTLDADSTIGDTMKAFAPASDGNDPVKYANTLATAVGVPVTTKISALSSAQLMTFQYNIAVAEGYNAAGNTARYIAPPQ